MRPREILVTGLGTVSAAGRNCARTLESFRCRQRNAGPISLFRTDLSKPVFEVRDLPECGRGTRTRTFELARCAANEALGEARLENGGGGLRIGVCLGTTVACQLNDIDFYREFRQHAAAPITAVKRYLDGNLAAAIAEEFGFSGPLLTVANACSSGTDAIGVAMAWLEADLCDVVLAGGADELSRIPLAGFSALGVLSDSLCMPFDKNRSGLNLGEGAGVVILERAPAAASRGVTSELFCAGYGTFADAHHLTTPRPDGSSLERAIRTALREAGITPDDIAFINAHGTATVNNDQVEGQVLARVFGSDCPVYSSKGYTGHMLGAAGGAEAAFTALALRHHWIPCTAGFGEPDPAIPLTPTAGDCDVNGDFAMSISLAFGGNNSALILGRRS